FGLGLLFQCIVFCPGVLVLGGPVCRQLDVEALFGRAIFVVGRLETPQDGIVSLFGVQWILNGALDGLVVFREWAVGKSSKGRENAADAFGIHDEWAHVVFGFGVHLEVGDVVAKPFLLCFVPPHLTA